MRNDIPAARSTGVEVANAYDKHSQTPAGRLRHALLGRYYDRFIRSTSPRWFFDIGGGSGILAAEIAKKHPEIRVILVDDDTAMTDRARATFEQQGLTGKIEIVVASVMDAGDVLKRYSLGDDQVLVGFNHVIEYVPDQDQAMRVLARVVPRGSHLGMMYMNQSHEAMRELFFRNNVAGVRAQLDDIHVDGKHFGLIRLVDTARVERIFKEEGLTEVADYGMRTISDLKPNDFLENHLAELIELELYLGEHRDFRGLARYRLKFLRR